MRRARGTIAGSMGLIALTAVGLASLRRPSYLTANAVFSLALVIHFAAIVAVLSLRGLARSFWMGFTACGWGYLILSVGPGSESIASPYLLTTTILDIAYQHWFADPSRIPPLLRGQQDNSPVISKWKLWDWPYNPQVNNKLHNSAFYIMTPDPFMRIGHSLFSLAFAFTGGLLGRHFARNSSGRTGLIGGNGPSPTIDSVTEHP
jgi:hypothetical protein